MLFSASRSAFISQAPPASVLSSQKFPQEVGIHSLLPPRACRGVRAEELRSLRVLLEHSSLLRPVTRGRAGLWLCLMASAIAPSLFPHRGRKDTPPPVPQLSWLLGAGHSLGRSHVPGVGVKEGDARTWSADDDAVSPGEELVGNLVKRHGTVSVKRWATPTPR